MAGYLLLKLNKGKNSYGFLGIRNNELYTDYNINGGSVDEDEFNNQMENFGK